MLYTWFSSYNCYTTTTVQVSPKSIVYTDMHCSATTCYNLLLLVQVDSLAEVGKP